MGAIGHLASLGKMQSYVSEITSYGIGETCAWRMSVLDDTSTYAFYFDVVNPHNNIIPESMLLAFYSILFLYFPSCPYFFFFSLLLRVFSSHG
jgi:hypothetical protein